MPITISFDIDDSKAHMIAAIALDRDDDPVVPEPAPLSAVPVPVVDAAVEAAPVAGWIGITGRFPVQVFEGGRLLGTSQSDRRKVESVAHRGLFSETRRALTFV